jgi:hypothetical protein
MNPGACILDAFGQQSTVNSQQSTVNNNSGATGIDITVDMDVDTHLWQVGKGKQLLTFHGQTIVSGSGDRKVKFWQICFNRSTKSHAQSSWRDRKWRMSRMWATKY